MDAVDFAQRHEQEMMIPETNDFRERAARIRCDRLRPARRWGLRIR
jgi:hypothetical protein